MVLNHEWQARIREYFTFTKQEWIFLIPAILVTAFIFSFRDWGQDTFDVAVGLRNLIIMVIVTTISFLARISWQKIFSLKEGYRAQFKGWWAGLIIALVIAFLSGGKLPLIFLGSVSVAFMVRQRLGEFRYGMSHKDHAKIGLQGMAISLFVAMLFAIGFYYTDGGYAFARGILLNVILAFGSLVPIPQLEGLRMFAGSRSLYLQSVIAVIIFGSLLVSGNSIALVIALILFILVTLFFMITDPGLVGYEQ